MLVHFPPATSTVSVAVVKVYSLGEPPSCLLRRRVVFLLSKRLLRKRYALTSRTIPFKTSFRISRNVSMIITSFPKNRKKNDNQPPSQFQLPLYSIISSRPKNLSVFDKIRGVTILTGLIAFKYGTFKWLPTVTITLDNFFKKRGVGNQDVSKIFSPINHVVSAF